MIIADDSGRVLEQWTGFQVAWTMARGYPGAFGRHVNALYIWLPLCLLFVLPFIDPRRPLSMLHLDLLVLLSFSVSLAFFNHGDIYRLGAADLPAARLPARADAVDGAPPAPAASRLNFPPAGSCSPSSALIGFRVALNVVDSNVIDVGFAECRRAEDRSTKTAVRRFSAQTAHGDTYGPVAYEAYVPFDVFGCSGVWDYLPARTPRRSSSICSRSAALRARDAASATPRPASRSSTRG